MKTDKLNNVIARQKQHLVRDMFAIAVLVLGLSVAAFAVALRIPTMTAPAAPETTVVEVDQSAAQITAIQIDDTPHYL
jgi:hypothetical protein